MRFQESYGGHDEARHTKGALEALFVDHALLYGMQRSVRVSQSFDGQDFLAANRVRQYRTGVVRHIVQQNGAGAALGPVTAELSACKSEFVTKGPSQGFLLDDVNAALLAVDVESDQTPA